MHIFAFFKPIVYILMPSKHWLKTNSVPFMPKRMKSSTKHLTKITYSKITFFYLKCLLCDAIKASSSLLPSESELPFKHRYSKRDINSTLNNQQKFLEKITSVNHF